MSLSSGQSLAHYQILELIGRGGMGEVYRARDTKLGRDVAIKVLPAEFMDSEERLARFKREAMVLASLNHPNIGGIYGVEESDSLRFLVLELVPGQTLAERLQEGPLSLAEALGLARQIAAALAAAHDAGVIHRDLKPANIKVTPSGQVKVLDFGLAKALVDAPVDAAISDSPTLSAHATKMGVILGTAAYMSPEQARGKAVDKRTDIFSFGAVLYEMLTGRQLFRGEDAADTMASVIRSDPDFRALPADVSPRVREVLARCLEKDREKRRRDIGDIGAELEASPAAVAVDLPRRAALPWFLAAAAAGAFLGGIAAWHLKPDPPPRSVQQFEILLPARDALRGLRGTIAPAVAMSPRGTHLVLAANNQLYLRPLDQVEAVPLRGTENAIAPFFSPDGSAIGFWADGSLKKLALAGGTPVQLCESIFPFGVSWAGDGTIVYSRQSGVWEVSENGGAPTELVGRTSEEYYYGPWKLSGGNELLMTVTEDPASWDRGAAIVVESLDTGERKTLVEGGSDARYLASGHLVYAVSSTLFAVAFDLETLEVAGEAVPVLEGVLRSSGQSGVAQFSVSEEGTLAYLPEEALAGQGLFWVERDGRVRRIGNRTGSFETPRVSPDGNRLAVTLLEGRGSDVWVVDLARETFTQLTRDGGRYPDWSPDGEWIVYTSKGDLYRVRSDFRSPPERMLEREGAQIHARWLPDGTGIVFQEGVAEAADLWVLDLESDAEPRVFLQTPANEAQPDLSPDGRSIAYHSSVSGGRSQIFVQPFDGPGARIQVSREEGVSPRWSPDGREIYFHGRENQAFLAASIRTGPVLEAGAPRLLFEWPIGMGFDRDYDVTPDGKRFVVVGPADPNATDASRPRVRIVLNWFEELKRLVPTH
jgi:serine/threonine-protein kinase